MNMKRLVKEASYILPTSLQNKTFNLYLWSQNSTLHILPKKWPTHKIYKLM